jgi:hypothetical protein
MMSWHLSGGQDLDKHVGHKVQVTGHTDWNGSSSGATSAGATSSTTTATGSSTTTSASQAASSPRLDVSSVKMISASCQ